MTSGKLFPQSAGCLVRQLIHVHASFYGSSWGKSYTFFMKVGSDLEVGSRPALRAVIFAARNSNGLIWVGILIA